MSKYNCSVWLPILYLPSPNGELRKVMLGLRGTRTWSWCPMDKDGKPGIRVWF